MLTLYFGGNIESKQITPSSDYTTSTISTLEADPALRTNQSVNLRVLCNSAIKR